VPKNTQSKPKKICAEGTDTAFACGKVCNNCFNSRRTSILRRLHLKKCEICKTATWFDAKDVIYTGQNESSRAGTLRAGSGWWWLFGGGGIGGRKGRFGRAGRKARRCG
jgi:hypothetical protein